MQRVRHDPSSVRACALLIALAALPLAGCGSSSSTSIVGPSASKCQIAVSPPPGSFPSGTASGSVGISTDRECSWSASTQSPWVSFTSPVTGQGDATLSFTLAANPAAAARTAQIDVNDQHVQVAQEAAPCRFQIDPTSDSVRASGGGGSIAVSTIAGCSWTASSSVPWISVDGGGTGTGRASFTVGPNAGAARSSTLTVAGLPFAVRQESGIVTPPPAPPPAPAPTPPPPPTPPPAPAPSPAPCRYEIAPTSQSVRADGGTVQVSVTAGAACAWTAGSQAAWMSVAPDSGSGSGRVTVTVQANTTANDRTGSVAVAGLTLTVTQAGLPVVQVTGTVLRRSGSCPSITFVVDASTSNIGTSAASTTVTTSSTTSFTGGSCKDVAEGARVHVSGIEQRNGTVAADAVQIQRKAKG